MSKENQKTTSDFDALDPRKGLPPFQISLKENKVKMPNTSPNVHFHF